MRITLAASFALAVLACVDVDGPPPEGPPDDFAPGEVTPLFGADRPTTFGVFEVGKTWPRDFLSVCWMHEVLVSGDPMVIALRPRAEQIVTREWARVGRVRFSLPPWSSCLDKPTSDIRIGIHRPALQPGFGSSAIGTNAQLIPAGEETMTLFFGPWGSPCGSPSPTSACPDDDGNEEPEPFIDVPKFQWITLHEFGHALGLRHEFAHEGTTGCAVEPIELHHDGIAYDGQSLFAFNASSVMSECSGNPNELSAGDIQALHVLYPGVVGLFVGAGHNSAPIHLGPGYYTSANVTDLGNVSSMVVPPGYRVTICAQGECMNASTTRLLDAPYNRGIRSIHIVPAVLAADHHGYQGATELMLASDDAPFAVLGNDTMSSVFPAPTRVAMVCTDRDAAGTCTIFTGGGPLDVDAVIFPPAIDNAVTHVTIGTRVITYDNVFRGNSTALGIGVYREGGHAAFPVGVQSLAIHGFEVRACTEVGIPTPVSPGGAGDCRTYTQSVDLAAQRHGPIRFLHVKLPQVVAP